MSVKVKLEENYPSEICPNCLAYLNISYDLKKQFEDSQEILNEHFAKCLEDIEENCDDEWKNSISPEEFIVYEENDLLPEVEVKVEKNLYENNEYVENVCENNVENTGIIKIENFEDPDELMDDFSKLIKITPDRKHNLQVKRVDVDKYIIEKPVIINSPIKLKDHDVKHLSSLDEELIQAAFNLKYECPGCPKVYSSLRNLKKHKEVCMKLKRFMGSQSQFVTINVNVDDVDSCEGTNSILYGCDQCDKSFLLSDELEQHKALEHSVSKLNIYEEFKLEDLSILDQELFKSALLLKYQCDTCSKVYSSHDKLEKHRTTCRKFKIKSGGKSQVDTKIVLKQSDDVMFSTDDVKSEVPCTKLMDDICLDNLSQDEKDMFQSALSLQHKCPNCRNFFSNEARFRRHQLNCGVKKASIESNQNIYSCDICGHISTSRKNYSYHKLTAHEERKYACEKCGRLFALKCVLTQHMQSHAKDKTKVVCPICGKGFHYSSGLFYHMKMHKKELNYLCDYCERRFINLNALKRHLATHTGERRYQCRICEKKFKGSAEVKRHEMRHTGATPHHCEYCDKGHSTKSNLQFHIITHKGHVPCDQCDRKFLNPDVLQLHMKIKHKTSKPNPFFNL